MVSCPRCRGIVDGEAIRTGHERGRYYHESCLRHKFEAELQDRVRKMGHSHSRDVKLDDVQFRSLTEYDERVFVRAPREKGL